MSNRCADSSLVSADSRLRDLYTAEALENSIPNSDPPVKPIPAIQDALEAFTANLPLDLLQSSEPLPGLAHTQTYFKLLGITPDQTVNLRALLPKNHPWQDVPWKAAISWKGTSERFLTDDFARHYQSMGYNLSLVVNQGGTLEREITTAIAFFVEHDDRTQIESIDSLRECGLPEPTFRINSGNKSVHHYWVIDTPANDIAEWKRIQRNLIALVQSDEHLRIPSFPMRLPGFYHVKTGNMATVFDVTGLKVSMADIDAICPQVPFTPRVIDGKAEIRVGEKASAIARSKPGSLRWAHIDAMDLPFDVPIELKSCLTKAHRDLIAEGAPEGKRRQMAVGLMKDLDGLFFLLDSIGQPISDDPWELLLQYAGNCTPAWEEDDAARLYESEEGRSEGASLTGENLERCVKGSAWRELKQIWEGAGMRNATVTLRELNGKGAASDEGMSAIDVASAELFEESQRYQNLSLVHVERGDKDKKDKISLLQQSKVASILKREWKGLLVFNLESHSFYKYGVEKDGLWSECSDLEIRTLVIKELDSRGCDVCGYGDHYPTGITKLLQSAEIIKEWGDTYGRIPLQNGVLDSKTRVLHPHSPDYRFTWQLPFAYDPTAKADKVIEFLMQSLEWDDGRVEICQAFLAAIVTSRADLQVFMEVIGTAGTGKSTFMKLAHALVGRENYHPVRLQSLETNRFEAANIYRKRLVTVTDSSEYTGGLSGLRTLTGDDVMVLERKNIQSTKTFRYQGMLLIAGNHPLQGDDHSDAISRRRLSMEFKVKPAVKKNMLSSGRNGQEWTGELSDCLPGLLNWVLALSFDRVTAIIEKNADDNPAQRATKLAVLLETHQIAPWFFDNCELTPEAKTGIGTAHQLSEHINKDGREVTVNFFDKADRDLYPNYAHWCKGANKKPRPMKNFTGELIDLINGQLSGTVEKGRNGRGVYISGITLTPEATKEAREFIGQT